MARRRGRGKESLIEALFGLPWQVSIVFGVALFIVLKWLVPAVGTGNVFSKLVFAAVVPIAWIITGGLFLIGILVFMKSVAQRKQIPDAEIFPVQERRYRTVHTPRSIASETLGKENFTQQEKPLVLESAKQPINVIEGQKKLSVDSSGKPTQWSIELIRDIEWKRFEDVCQRFYELNGIKSETTPLGPDGGIDIRLFQDDSGKVTSIVQCKSWGDSFVGVKPVRELLGVMTHEKISKAVFMTSGSYSNDAKTVAARNNITLVSGEIFLLMILRLPESDQQSLLSFAIAGEYKTPTCPACGTKMRLVKGKAGRTSFWGCHNYPRCRKILNMRRPEK